MTGQQQLPTTLFTPDEHRALRVLHTRYARDRGQFSRREQTHLRFVRWIYQAGRLESVQRSMEPPSGSVPIRSSARTTASTSER